MNREHQVLQDINKEYNAYLKFSPGEEVSVLESRKAKRQIEVPGRVEGRFRKQAVVEERLAEVATYACLSDFYADKKVQAPGYDPDAESWSLEDMPEDVIEKYEAWTEQVGAPDGAEFSEAIRSKAALPIDRMAATQPCPDCHRGTKYACRTSGYAQELYHYPLIQAKDERNGEVYEVPLDAALYAALQPEELVCVPEPEFSGGGFMSARYTARLTGDTLSDEYVRRATNGAVNLEAAHLKILPGAVGLKDVVVYLGGWQENGINTYVKHLAADEIIDQLQAEAAKQYAERVTDTNYNHIFTTLRHDLGKRGMSLAFWYKYMGMGDSDAVFSVVDEANEIRGSVRSIDAYEALTELQAKIRFA